MPPPEHSLRCSLWSLADDYKSKVLTEDESGCGPLVRSRYLLGKISVIFNTSYRQVLLLVCTQRHYNSNFHKVLEQPNPF